MIPALLDHTALLALGAGYPALSGFVVDAAAGRATVQVPALCLTAAEAERRGVAEHIGALPGLDIESLDLSATIPVGALIADGVDWRIAHAVHASRPTADFPQGRVVLSVQPHLYDGTGVDPIDPGKTF
ncbi:hypothetical protein [Streptomyces sp. H39-S7]|uniref:hypothetical protein n=1 Tax=Streptomyces sp. H39-S7 TaxID=3004357 RepID=UPI0022B01AF5|nr:hypothetical protein [Streptomyces sp. H39-S7]MCZ4124986.1 hypothetical protein [Streptomyces sp. H39-S7]